MLAISLELLTARYGATAYNDRSRGEWPPHPARLFSALVATWADADEPDDAEREALVWLESQPPPQLICSSEAEVTRRRVVTAYVPGNDATALRKSLDVKHQKLLDATRKLSQDQQRGDIRAIGRSEVAIRKLERSYQDGLGAAMTATGSESASVISEVLEVIPENRNHQPRSYPTVSPEQPTVVFQWPNAQPTTEQQETLDGLLARVGRLGHSSTLVSCRVANEPQQSPAFVPRADGLTVLRVPGSGLLERLELEFVRHQGSRERLMPTVLTRYGPPTPERERVAPPTGALSGDWILLALTSGSDQGDHRIPLRNTRSLELARAVRAALEARLSEDHVPFVTGKWSDGRPRPHLAVVPLADVGHRWADGLIRGVALMAPTESDPDALIRIMDVLRSREHSGLVVGLPTGSARLNVRFSPAITVPLHAFGHDWEDLPYALRRATWCRPSRRWVSATPVAFDRFVKGLNSPQPRSREAADAAARNLVAASCRHAGLPTPDEVVISPVGMVRNVPPASNTAEHRGRSFPRFVAAGSGDVKQCAHVAVTFPKPVRGPVLLGAGRYLGYGLFMPMREQGEST